MERNSFGICILVELANPKIFQTFSNMIFEKKKEVIFKKRCQIQHDKQFI